MCAIFGYVSKGKSWASVDFLADIVNANKGRGGHAFGFAWVDWAGRMHCYKQQGKLEKNLHTLEMLRGAKVLIGHLRYTTQGSEAHNINNHPHPVDGGWLVHNGMISNYSKLIKCCRLNISSECDSEVLGLLAENSIELTYAGRLSDAVSRVEARNALCVAGIWKNPSRVIAVRRGNPLSLTEVPGGYYFASIAVKDRAVWEEIPNGQILEFMQTTRGKVRIKKTAMILPIVEDTRPALFHLRQNGAGW